MGDVTAPLIAGLAIGITFLVIVSIFIPPSIHLKPRISQLQALEIVGKDLQARDLGEIYEVIAFENDFENRTYMPYSDFDGSNLRLPLIISQPGSDVSITIVLDDGGSTISRSCANSADSLVCIVSCFSKGKLFWVVDIFSEYYAVDALNGDILFSQNRQEQLMNDAKVAECSA